MLKTTNNPIQHLPLRKNDSTDIGGWIFTNTAFQPDATSPSTQYFIFYVTSDPGNDDDRIGRVVFTVDLSGIKLTDSVVNHETVVDYIYTGTGKWRYNSSDGTLKNYFKITGSGDMTYKFMKPTYTDDPSQYFATLDGFGK
jgi:hypothetical protein